MDAHDLFVRHGLQAERIRCAQVRLLRERELLEICLRLHVGKVDTLKLLRIERRAFLQRLELSLQEVKLFVGELHGLLFSLFRTTGMRHTLVA